MPRAAIPAGVIHASAVAVGRRGALILGASGSGKSTLALELVAFGAALVGDDRVAVRRDEDGLLLAPAPNIEGLIEARGAGLIRLPWTEATLRLVVDLDRVETDRLPARREVVIEDRPVTCLHRVETPAFASIVMACLRGERVAP